MNLRELIVFLVLIAIPAMAQAKPVTVQVKGMVCGFCAQGIEKKFKAMPEVNKINVSLETKIVTVDVKDASEISDEQIKKIITESGYEVVKIERAK